MADETFVDNARFPGAVRNMADVIPQLHKTARDMENTVATHTGWSGEARGEFNNFHTRLQGSLQKLDTALTQLSNSLEAGFKKYGGMEADNRGLFSKIQTDEISAPLTNLGASTRS
ncbi:WXG100 family type VII secretion target [Nocardia sp. KC 131]|uniref:WXG100 family type VII secretion target n=1 Tax=Nocardia arseniciresistens TaxID=3392119 RepID=UPI00398F6D3A